MSTGKATIIAPSGGSNSLTTPDDPTIDAGLVRFNLILEKALVTTGKLHPGDPVTFELTPSNEGPTDASAKGSASQRRR